MKISIDALNETIDLLREIVDILDAQEQYTIETSCNTYGMDRFISFGRYGYLTLDPDKLYELAEREEN